MTFFKSLAHSICLLLFPLLAMADPLPVLAEKDGTATFTKKGSLCVLKGGYYHRESRSCLCNNTIPFDPQLVDCATIKNRSRHEKDNILKSLAQVLEQPMDLYRWSKPSGLAILRDQSFDMKKVNGDGSAMAAGPGIYAAARPDGSVEYATSPSHFLMRIRVLPGHSLLDISDDRVGNKILALGLTKADIEQTQAPLIIKYNKDRDWWVVKTPHRLQFSLFDGEGRSMEELFELEEKMGNNMFAKKILQEQTGKLRRKHFADRGESNPQEERCLQVKRPGPLEFLGHLFAMAAEKDETVVHLWRYDGSCGRFTRQRPRTLLKSNVDIDLCRRERGSVYFRDEEGTCSEAAAEDQRLIIRKLPHFEKGKCPSQLYCSQAILNQKNVYIPREREVTLLVREAYHYDDLKSCRQALEKQQTLNIPFLCVQGASGAIQLLSLITGSSPTSYEFPSWDACRKGQEQIQKGYFCAGNVGHLVPFKNLRNLSDDRPWIVYNNPFSGAEDCEKKMGALATEGDWALEVEKAYHEIGLKIGVLHGKTPEKILDLITSAHPELAKRFKKNLSPDLSSSNYMRLQRELLYINKELLPKLPLLKTAQGPFSQLVVLSWILGEQDQQFTESFLKGLGHSDKDIRAAASIWASREFFHETDQVMLVESLASRMLKNAKELEMAPKDYFNMGKELLLAGIHGSTDGMKHPHPKYSDYMEMSPTGSPIFTFNNYYLLELLVKGDDWIKEPEKNIKDIVLFMENLPRARMVKSGNFRNIIKRPEFEEKFQQVFMGLLYHNKFPYVLKRSIFNLLNSIFPTMDARKRRN